MEVCRREPGGLLYDLYEVKIFMTELMTFLIHMCAVKEYNM